MRSARPRQPMFERVAIIGVGLIGGSLGLALRRRGLAGEVVGFARRKETLDAAESVGAIDRRAASAPEAVAGADLVVLAAPVAAIIARVKEIAPYLKRGALVTDVGSTKKSIVSAAARCLPAGVHFIGGHPMAGSEKAGVASAREDLFEAATWLLTPSRGPKQPALRKLERLVIALGARPLIVAPDLHDRLVAGVSHLPHIAAVSLVEVAAQLARRDDRAWQVAATGFRDATRMASGDPDIWRDICLANRAAIRSAIRVLSRRLAAWDKALARANPREIERLLSRAKSVRDSL